MSRIRPIFGFPSIQSVAGSDRHSHRGRLVLLSRRLRFQATTLVAVRSGSYPSWPIDTFGGYTRSPRILLLRSFSSAVDHPSLLSNHSRNSYYWEYQDLVMPASTVTRPGSTLFKPGHISRRSHCRPSIVHDFERR